jgi:hypothetical protein
MAETQRELEGQLGFLTEQVGFLKDKIDELSARLQILESGKSIVHQPDEARALETSTPVQEHTIPQEGVLKKAGTGSLLPRVATVCFAMVIPQHSYLRVGGFIAGKTGWHRFFLPVACCCFFPLSLKPMPVFSRSRR